MMHHERPYFTQRRGTHARALLIMGRARVLPPAPLLATAGTAVVGRYSGPSAPAREELRTAAQVALIMATPPRLLVRDVECVLERTTDPGARRALERVLAAARRRLGEV